MDNLMDKGYVMIARQLVDSEIFEKPASWLKILIFLLIQAQHKPYKRLKRGQCYTTYASISEACKVTRSEVDHAIRYMKKTQMLATQKATRGMVVTICNYDTYQDVTVYRSDSKSDTKATQTTICGDLKATQKRQDKQEWKNDKNDNKKTTGGFDVFYKAYPKKKSKDSARRRWKAIKPNAELLETMLVAIEQQKKSEQWTKDGGQFIPHPATWLNDGGWKDELPQAPETELEKLARIRKEYKI